ncbi:MAG: M48 family metalloprotease [Prolixibacteraceae bacterium]|jgi:predicted Zn-dependent protease|nr:M48 family metalloprotease [Prolixibacteraceae bacterium]MDI9563352.1 M48 family metalloprotease [Bacteroidota bacterium]NLS98686.1 M48 family metalloprotease [Bacteroidales bacterium]HNZ68410.1 M48 family metalloprotease [Prolixibacteraceae bacterium]HOC86260.1 M48 family metalloprotease [Prolixibacteraceae bacterium]
MKNLNLSAKVVVLLATLLMIPSCAVNPVTGKRQIMLMSEAQEIAMGAQYDPQVLATFGVYPDQKLNNFVQKIGDDMGLISHRPNLKYHIKVVDSPVVNAFAVPGGYIYLTRGILAQFNNEAELVGVIGHEMGHVTARHSVSQQTKQTLGQIALIGGMILSPKIAEMGEMAMQGLQLLFLKFSRDDEREADKLGAEYASKISYDAHKMADFFQVLNKMNMAESEGGVPTFLSTHPDPGDRYNSVHQYATNWQQQLQNTNWKVNRDSYLRMIDGIVYGEDPRQGYTEFNTFYHPELKFRFNYPLGWQFQNSPIQVQMAPKDGSALMVFTFARGSNLQIAADSTLLQLGVTVQERQSTTVNGLPAIATVSVQTSQDQSTGQQVSNQLLSYFYNLDGNFYVLHGLAGSANFAKLFPTMQGAMKTFARLTDASKINVKPDLLRVKQVARTSTLQEAFRTLGIPADKYQEYAFLNNLELTDQVQSGQMIKIVTK